MKESEKKILHPTAELLSLITSHPTYSIVYVYGDGWEQDGIAENVRYSVSAAVSYKDEIYTDKDDLSDAIETELYYQNYSQDANNLFLEATERANKIWTEAIPCILAEVW